MNDRQRGLFIDVVDLGSFSKAAEAHFVTPQSVSQQVRRLEDELGFALLERTAQGVSPTEAGWAFYEGCLRIGRELDELVKRCARLAAVGRGVLRLGSSTTYSLALFARFVPGFLRAHPEVLVTYVDVEADPIAGLLGGAYDVLEGVRPDGEASERDIAFLPLYGSRRCCLASARNPLSHRSSVAPGDLRGQRVYVFSRAWAANLQAYLDGCCPGITLIELPSTDHRTVMRLCDAEDAVYLAPEQLVERFDPLIPVPFDADVVTEYGLLYLQEARPRLEPLLVAAREAFEGQAGV